jgi:hypothetical protein
MKKKKTEPLIPLHTRMVGTGRRKYEAKYPPGGEALRPSEFRKMVFNALDYDSWVHIWEDLKYIVLFIEILVLLAEIVLWPIILIR